MATKRKVEQKLRELIGRLDGSSAGVHRSLADALPEGRTIEVRLPDLETSYWTEMIEGRMGALRSGAPERSDIRMTVDSDHLVEIIDGRRSMFSSYMTGAVKIEASLSDLLRLRRLA